MTTVATINVHNVAPADPVQSGAEATQYALAYAGLDDGPSDEIPRRFDFTAFEYGAVLSMLPGLRLIHPRWPLDRLLSEAKRIVDDVEAAGDE